MVFLPSIRRKYMVSRRQRGAEVSMSECVVTLLDRNTHEPTDRVQYTGSAQTLDVSVTWEGAPLAVNTDYTLSWANNTNVGPATVTVTGTGQFSGGVTKTFYVVSGGGSVLEWTFDLADSSCVGSLSLSGDYARSISLGRDDSELFVLSTAGAIRKVTIPSNGTIANATIGGAISGETGADAFVFCDGGKKVVFSKSVHGTNYTTYLWLVQLSSPYDVSSITGGLDTSNADMTISGRFYVGDMSDDGLHLFCYKTDAVCRYDLQSPFVLGGAELVDSVDRSYVVENGSQYIYGMKVSPLGGMMLVAQVTSKIFQSSLSTQFLPSSATKGSSATTSSWFGPFVVNRRADRLYQVKADAPFSTVTEYSLSAQEE